MESDLWNPLWFDFQTSWKRAELLFDAGSDEFGLKSPYSGWLFSDFGRSFEENLEGSPSVSYFQDFFGNFGQKKSGKRLIVVNFSFLY